MDKISFGKALLRMFIPVRKVDNEVGFFGFAFKIAVETIV